jgi:hypothetical protein
MDERTPDYLPDCRYGRYRRGARRSEQAEILTLKVMTTTGHVPLPGLATSAN